MHDRLPPPNAIAPNLDRVLFETDGSMLGRVIGSDALFIACAVLLFIAVIALVATRMARQEARFSAQLAGLRGQRMDQLIRTVSLAEDIAGLGIWQYDPATGSQQWSNGLRRIFDVPEDEPFLEGDAETLLLANDIDLVGAIKERLAEVGPYDLRFDMMGLDGRARSLAVEACNLRDDEGKTTRVIGVVRDVTDQIARVRQLEFSRAVAQREARRAQELAQTDPLTGLANRRSLMGQLDEMILKARRISKPLVLIVFDIDHFKTVNDTYGHLAGDKVLQTIARIAKDQAREADIMARVGGEEFVWVVPGADESSARVMSERLRHAIANDSATETVPSVTISAGLAELTQGDTSLSLFARADSALYAAKGAGRNQVRMAA
ncbi:GGDEF domain-containing protein [Erythrobacter rubeus]|uniref:diguanylate cyclase n=1 Tax=Erythrobacter rubeus TaxID=2760803 RepID=A0ABR8KLQ0_9SPHN|nr:sensor domain-containing diguanylate cyclase [Erythrobacter rubeus]MBD2841374.1 sensor domain-containing diguanylate cyclase [Erythrobacter rubeus]